jgi:diguanylate cyclase (GGDEF)-like protein/PAS domain S-box-containing protein
MYPRGVKVPEAFYRELLDSLIYGIYFVDRERRISYWNRGAELITGYASADVVGSYCWNGLLRSMDGSGHILCQGGCPLAATMADGAERESEVALLHKQGHRVPVKVRACAIRNETGEILGAAGTLQDQTEHVQALQRVDELHRLAYLDALTGVGNRRYAEVELTSRLAELNRRNFSFGLLFVDIDHFKRVNDTHGHEVGDAVLKTVANTLRHGVRTDDFVGRWGGEELVVFAGHPQTGALQVISNRFRLLIEASTTTIPEGHLSVTVSIGGAVARVDDTPETLVARADKLMYQAKALGRNSVVVES